MSSQNLLCKSANDHSIFYDPIHSHAATHFEDAPGLKKVTVELLSSRNIDSDIIAEDVDMGKIVGSSDVVEVGDEDEIIYAMRAEREDQGYVPFVKKSQITTKFKNFNTSCA